MHAPRRGQPVQAGYRRAAGDCIHLRQAPLLRQGCETPDSGPEAGDTAASHFQPWKGAWGGNWSHVRVPFKNASLSPMGRYIYAGVCGCRGDREARMHSLLFRGCGEGAGAPCGKMSSSCAQKDAQNAHAWHFCPKRNHKIFFWGVGGVGKLPVCTVEQGGIFWLIDQSPDVAKLNGGVGMRFWWCSCEGRGGSSGVCWECSRVVRSQHVSFYKGFAEIVFSGKYNTSYARSAQGSIFRRPRVE